MADTKLSVLAAASQADDADLLYLVQGGVSKRITRSILFNLIDQIIQRAEIKDYSETLVTLADGSPTGDITIDLEDGNVFEFTLTDSIDAVSVVNPPASGKHGSFTLYLTQESGSPGERTFDFSWAQWAGGTPPTLTAEPGAVDVFTFTTRDGGTTWYGFTGGQNFS